NELRNSVTFQQLLAHVPRTLLPADNAGHGADFYFNTQPVFPGGQSGDARQSSAAVTTPSQPVPGAPPGLPTASQPPSHQTATRPPTDNGPSVPQMVEPQQQWRDQQEFQRRNIGLQNVAQSLRAQVASN